MRQSTHAASSAFAPLYRLHMSETERLRVNAYIHDGEVIADLMSGALAGIRSGVELAERGIKAILPGHVTH